MNLALHGKQNFEHPWRANCILSPVYLLAANIGSPIFYYYSGVHTGKRLASTSKDTMIVAHEETTKTPESAHEEITCTPEVNISHEENTTTSKEVENLTFTTVTERRETLGNQ